MYSGFGFTSSIMPSMRLNHNFNRSVLLYDDPYSAIAAKYRLDRHVVCLPTIVRILLDPNALAMVRYKEGM